MIRRRLPFAREGVALLALVCATTVAALGQEGEDEMSLPEAAPVPVERPENAVEDDEEPREEDETLEDETPEDESGPAEDDGDAGQPAGEDDEETPDDEGEEAEEDAPPEPPEPPEPEDPAELRACRAELRGLGAEFRRSDPILPADGSEAGCGVAAPFSVSAILPGVSLQPETQMRCRVALALARWVKNEVQPAADALEMGALASVEHGSTYVCRGRNNDENADLSEHAKGNAIDVMSLTFDTGETIAVLPRAGDGDDAEVFQSAIRGGACLHFTTVLGPGSDAYHDDHLHLDLAERSSGYRLCQ